MTEMWWRSLPKHQGIGAAISFVEAARPVLFRHGESFVEVSVLSFASPTAWV